MQKKYELYFHRRIMRIALPAMLAQLSFPLLGMVDTAVMGHFGSTVALAAIAIGAGLFMVVANSVGFLRSSTLGLIAQALGRGDHSGLRDWFLRSLLLALLISLILTVFSGIVLHYWHWENVESQIYESLNTYLRMRLWGLPANIIGLVMLGVMLGCQDSRAVLRVMLIANFVNMTLDFVFVVGFGMMADGVALATVIAEYLGAFYGLWIVLRKLRSYGVIIKKQHIIAILRQIAALRILLNLNGHFFIRSTVLSFCFAMMPLFSVQLGAQYAAANAVVINLLFMTSYTLDGIANASEALVGLAVGRKLPKMLKGYLWRLHLWVVPILLVFFCTFLLSIQYLLLAQTADVLVQDIAMDLRYWLYLALLLSPWCMLLDGVFYGATLGREVSSAMVLAGCGFIACLFILPMYFGNGGIWLSLNLFFVARAVGLYLQLPAVMQKARKIKYS